MSIYNLEMIAQHEISERRYGRIYALTLLAVIGVVIAALITAA